MGANTFLDFDLLIELQNSGFRARISKSPVGEGAHDFSLPFSPQDLDAVFALFGRTAPNAPRPQRASDLAREFGMRLYDAVFAEQIKSSYLSSAQFAATQNAGLRIRLHLNDAPALADAPWELLHDGTDFVALQPQRALVRYLELPQPIKPLPVAPPLRALAILSSPKDFDPLDIAREWEHLNDALADVISTGLFEIDLLEQPTLTALQNQLRRSAYHILHFSGHGEYDASAANHSQGALVFQDEYGKGQAVNALTLARHLADHSTLRLVVLNACEGARASTRDAFTGAAQTLMRQNIPAVIAMQFEITDDAAQNFARTLYDALANQMPIDAAVSDARKRLANDENLEWATPVLFTRVDDGNLFARDALDENARRALKRAAMLRMANAALENGNFARANDYANRLRAMDARDAAARDLSEKIQRRREASEFYAQGRQYSEQQRWQDAVNAFKQVQARQVNYLDTPVLLAEALRAVTMNGAPVSRAPRPDENQVHYKDIVREMLRSKVVPFLGLGANLFGRAPQESWQAEYGAPSGEELARYLAANYDYDEMDRSNLIRVSQYVAVTRDNTALYDELHQVLEAPYAPTPLHRFWAELPAQLRARGPVEFYPILATSNYDLLLEKAFRDQGEEFDSLIYLAEGKDKGKFLHRTHDGAEIPVDDPSDYPNMRLNERTTIIRVHGAVASSDSPYESFVITEDHFLDLLQTNITSLLPRTVAARLRESYVLFMGCNLRNWSLRGLLYRLAKTKYRPWLIQPQLGAVEKEYWRGLNVRVLDLADDEFLLNLSVQLTNTLAGGAQ